MNKQIIVFLALAFGISWSLDALIINGNVQQEKLILAVMCGPGIAAIITSLWFSKSLKSLGFALTGKQYLLAGYLLPLLYAIPVYVIIWLIGFAPFNTGFSCNYFILFSVGQLIQLPGAVGQEIGWRGFLYPKLSKNYGGFTAAFITGITWALWQYPLVVCNNLHGAPL